MKKAWSLLLLAALLLSGCGQPVKNQDHDAQPTTAQDEDGRIELVMATLGSANAALAMDRRVYEAADGFNASQDRYHLTIINYNTGENGNTAAGEEQGMTRLLTEIAAGQYPDLVCFDNISPYPFISKGVLLDMESCMAGDEDIRIEDIMCYRALRAWGGVYMLSNCLSITSQCGLSSRFGDRVGWTLQEYLELEGSLPEGSYMHYKMKRENFLKTIAKNYLGTAIDWEKGTCDFNNSAFIAILEASGRISERWISEQNEEIGVGGRASLEEGEYILQFYGPAFPHELPQLEEGMTPIGWPTVDGRCGTMVYYQNPIGMVAQSKHIDGAWAFIKYLLMTPDEENMRMPTWRPLLEDALQRAQHSETFPCITAEQGEAFMALLDRVEIFYQHDPVVLDIIMKECEPFLAGERSAEETAALIQSRMQIYVAEQG